MHSRLACLTCLAIAIAALAVPGHADPVDIQPTSVEIPAQAGARHRQMLTITNTSTGEALALTLGLADWSMHRNGQLALSAPDGSRHSAASWARFTPSFLPLDPGQSGQVIVDIIIPAKPATAGGHRFAVLASEVAPGPDGRMRKIEAASLFYLTIGPAVSEPVINAVRIAGEDGRHLEIDLSNSGNAHARLEGKVQIEGHGGEQAAVPVSNLVVLEGGERTFTLPLAGPLPGNPRVTVTLDNVFAPQSATGTMPVRTLSAPLQAPSG